MPTVMATYRRIALFSLAFSLYTPFAGFTQEEGYAYTLHGYLGIEGGESFNYRLLLNDSTGPYLRGIAYTYAASGKRVTAQVVGRRYPDQKTLHIQETAILANEGFQSKAVICLINASLKTDTATGALRGPIITQTIENGSTCSKGSIALIRSDEIAAVFQARPDHARLSASPERIDLDSTERSRAGSGTKRLPVQPRRSASVEGRQQAGGAPVSQAGNAQRSPIEITAGKPRELRWSSRQLRLKIWDDKNTDGDRISIFLNSECVLNNYTLTQEGKTLVLELSDGELNTLTITALNNGTMPPNTAHLLLLDGEKEHAVVAHNTPGKSAVIHLIR